MQHKSCRTQRACILQHARCSTRCSHNTSVHALDCDDGIALTWLRDQYTRLLAGLPANLTGPTRTRYAVQPQVRRTVGGYAVRDRTGYCTVLQVLVGCIVRRYCRVLERRRSIQGYVRIRMVPEPASYAAPVYSVLRLSHSGAPSRLLYVSCPLSYGRRGEARRGEAAVWS
jgi:hypothetical protein